jgi:putative DNA primase/helicase
MSRRLAAVQKPDAEDAAFAQTEAGDAEFFAHLHADQLAYDHARRAWFCRRGHVFVQDATEQVTQLTVEMLRRRQAAALANPDADDRARAIRRTVAAESETHIRHVLRLAGSHPTLALAGTEWDADPLVLAASNGIVDLGTGALRAAKPEDRICRVAAVDYNPDADCPRFRRLVSEVADGDDELAGFLWRSVGYAITGLTSEQVFWILYGLGANGKTTFLETLTRYVLPEHSWAMPFPAEAWTESIAEYQRAELAGRRIVIAKESAETKRLNSEFIKSLTGGDTVNARHPYGRPFTFVPQAKFFLACNHQPTIRDDSHGMWRRVRLVPFRRTFAVNPKLAEELAAEAPGILRWCVDGCLDWQLAGLGTPAAVADATASYAAANDPLSAFLAERCVLAGHVTAPAGPLFSAYCQWADEAHVGDAERLNLRTFGERMKSRFEAITGRRVTYRGVALREERS